MGTQLRIYCGENAREAMVFISSFLYVFFMNAISPTRLISCSRTIVIIFVKNFLLGATLPAARQPVTTNLAQQLKEELDKATVDDLQFPYT